KQEIVQRIQRLGPEIRAVGVERLGLFGSFVRGRATQDSDVDILVEFAQARIHSMNKQISISREALAAFCRERGIRRLAVVGSALRNDVRPDSDIDLLVESGPDRVPGLFAIARMERELSGLLSGRKVDLRTRQDLSRYFRQRVIEEAEVQYERS